MRYSLTSRNSGPIFSFSKKYNHHSYTSKCSPNGELNRPELDVESVLGAGAGNALDGADELKRDGDEACLNTEGDDDEVVKRLDEVERGKVDEVNGIDEVLEPVKLKDGISGANIFDGVEVLKRLEDV